jgi:hypothetical protein
MRLTGAHAARPRQIMLDDPDASLCHARPRRRRCMLRRKAIGDPAVLRP